MKETEMILQMAHENNGTVTTAMVTKAGISRGNLKYLTDTGKLERSGRGVYVLPEIWDDEFFAFQARHFFLRYCLILMEYDRSHAKQILHDLSGDIQFNKRQEGKCPVFPGY